MALKKTGKYQKLLTLKEQIIANDLVMEEIIKHLNVAGLKIFRLVCSDWYKKSIEAWNKKAFVHIAPPPEGSRRSDGNDPQVMTQFIKETCDQDFRNILGEHPFQNFSLSTCKDESGVEKQQEMLKIMENMWKECGQFAFHLQLKIRNPNPNHCLKSIVRELGANVTTLDIICNYETPRDVSTAFMNGPVHKQVKRLTISYAPIARYSFLIKFPNLEELQMTHLSTSEIRGDNDIFSNLHTFRYSKQKKNILNLKHLDLINSYTQDLSSFVAVDIPLNYLSLKVGGERLNCMENFERFIEHYAKSLISLKLRESAHFRLPMPPGFPVQIDFRNLQVLELWGNLIDNLNFLKRAPHLKKLRLDLLCNELTEEKTINHSIFDNARNIVDNSRDIVRLKTFQCLELQELILDFQLSEDSWKTLGHWMPNLSALEAPLGNTSFRLVCAQWPSLRKLGLRLGSDIDDDGIVGENGHDEKEVNGPPTILDLKRMESFTMDLECGQGKLTDRSAEFGFLKMTCLWNLKAFVSPHLFSEEMEKQLKAQIRRVEIIRNCQNERMAPPRQFEAACCDFAAKTKRF